MAGRRRTAELGDGYEYLIKKFADDSGHTAQEFYTNRILVHLMTIRLEPQPGESVYDPTCGTGGMLISTVAEVKRQGKEWRNLRLYGQELNYGTSAIARMNLFLHGVTDGHIAHGIRCRSRHSMMDPDACRRCGFCSLWLNAEHQEFTNLIWNGLRTCAKTAMTADPEQCWRVSTETNVFFGRTGMSDFVTPDFMVYKCLPEPYQYVRSDRVVLVGEVLSPSNSGPRHHVLHRANYVLAGTWSPTDAGAVTINHPFPISVPWSDLEF